MIKSEEQQVFFIFLFSPIVSGFMDMLPSFLVALDIVKSPIVKTTL